MLHSAFSAHSDRPRGRGPRPAPVDGVTLRRTVMVPLLLLGTGLVARRTGSGPGSAVLAGTVCALAVALVAVREVRAGAGPCRAGRRRNSSSSAVA
ncbi:hypothetical protein ACFY9A_36245 [Streptomyces rubradiris]|uniref:hypothetical protein n=1 Tax=Streptomyces rubradiris TaxID=285531 RepID=UPI0036E795B1